MPGHLLRRLATGATAAVLAGVLTACGGPVGGADEPDPLRVWLMSNSLTEELTHRIVADFEDHNPDRRVEVTVQEWAGIGEKVTAALDSDEAPDLIEVGNTQVARYAATGHLRNLTLQVPELGGDDWITGLEEPGKIDGYQYGIPYYGANRVVIYRKDLFADAGITEPPATREEWLEVTERLNRPEAGQQGIYLPGQNWYVLAGFIWDEGGELAVERSGHWEGALHTSEALRGMEFYRELHALGDAPADRDEAEPEHGEVFAENEIAQLIAPPGHSRIVIEHNPELADKLGYFPIPGKEPGTPGAVFTGGSVLIVPENAGDPEGGYAFLRTLTSDTWQREIARTMSYVPNRTTLTDALKGDPGAEAMARGAESGRATPNSPAWAGLEADNPIKEYQTEVLTGADPRTAAEKASQAVTARLRHTGAG
ncbi:extracellular solute-binding protein [Streptomyces sp. WMMC897]|uniref:extracellular solute-binding protein n=1 Tax=Streptomyces sp. WMMC897 TaxID=3014782 RepID=UPI0022B726D5|nr:extracellular solute-binding protein [Streptomyces sp. WMMC897]MCZ7415654.1 extracellular solute-binding protein [Streptomyces sp. WMMC897]